MDTYSNASLMDKVHAEERPHIGQPPTCVIAVEVFRQTRLEITYAALFVFRSIQRAENVCSTVQTVAPRTVALPAGSGRDLQRANG